MSRRDEKTFFSGAFRKSAKVYMIRSSKDAGKMEMLPWIGVAAVGASLLTVATIKVVDYFKSKRTQNQQAIEAAKQEIINGIKAYDEEQERYDSVE